MTENQKYSLITNKKEWFELEAEGILKERAEEDVDSISQLSTDLTTQLIRYFKAAQKTGLNQVELQRLLAETLFDISNYFNIRAANTDKIIKNLAK